MATDDNYGDLISEEIKRLEAIRGQRRRRGLRFSARMEKQFREFYNREFQSYRRASLMVAVVVLVAIGMLDVVVFGDAWSDIAVIRYGAGIPFVMIAAAMVFSPYYGRFQQEIVTQACFFVSMIATAILLVGPDRVYPLYLTAYVLLAMFIGVIARVTFTRAAMVITSTYITFNLLILWLRPQPIDVIASYNAYYLCAAMMTLAANYYMERSVRREFVQDKILRLERSQLKEANVKLQHMATIDPLTGVDNRRQLEKNIHAEWNRGARTETPLSIMMIDIDHFKKYNDSYGHQMGDQCLERVAQAIKGNFKRASDTVARYGGEEFAVLLPDVTESDAISLARQLCEVIHALEIPHKNSDTADVVTLSVGVATCVPNPDMTYERLMLEADTALYHAKEQGRDRAIAYDSVVL